MFAPGAMRVHGLDVERLLAVPAVGAAQVRRVRERLRGMDCVRAGPA